MTKSQNLLVFVLRNNYVNNNRKKIMNINENIAKLGESVENQVKVMGNLVISNVTNDDNFKRLSFPEKELFLRKIEDQFQNQIRCVIQDINPDKLDVAMRSLSSSPEVKTSDSQFK